MLKLRALAEAKAKAKAQEEAGVKGNSEHPSHAAKPALLRLQKDLDNIDLPKEILEYTTHLNETPMRVNLSLKPDIGYYAGGTYYFNLFVKDTYPMEPPVVKCMQRIYHPNIDIDGNVCLNLLREDWTPALDLQSIVIGLLFLFHEPNGKDPLNQDAAKTLMEDPSRFEAKLNYTLRGSNIDGVWYDKVMN
ncbi:NEDD8-conjugating enzyme UBC12 [Kluyveromyces marxianus]|uniref:NEDD8-conjugating enzyme UBC12 n=2 Tax=Kluyveromyces marxianus TaxID=4911 RepID=W0T9W7_KLUMD|nr:NEDD8-conjugating enzyme UBC12 [Kluyveromyces marxianus DMKU3-1042]QGN15319.1 NEDD8-conjugating enzyme UBC12 [Kluyveromyces marxianus]BAO39611.1 NEDD8-conjugating enzyme UBC12 [Kluyveromyces marxianus DMKU3-1042]BAP71096.1 NEDD8-conjugating enzyme UBC12 [Kluyveromyces marxianus]